MSQKRIILITILLVFLSVVASYLHRFLVVDHEITPDLPVITDTVIPASGPIAELTNS